MSTDRFIEARYGDWASIYLSNEDRVQCEIRQRGIWAALKRIVGTTLDEPWTEEVHSPRALPAFVGTVRGGPSLVWDAGLGTLFDHLSFSMPYEQPLLVIEATLRRVAAVRCVVAGHPDQASRQVDLAIELLEECPIDRSYQERVDIDQQFEVFLITELQERFALAHELAHYLKTSDEQSFDMMMQNLTSWIEQARKSNTNLGLLRVNPRASWREEAANRLYRAGLDPYAWYLHGHGPDPVSSLTWPTLHSDLELADSLLKNSSDSEREEIICDLLGALAVVLDAHEREHGWTAIAGAAGARLALANLQVILGMDAWVSSDGAQPLSGWSSTTRQRCLNAFLPVAVPAILQQANVESCLQAGDVHTVMHLVEERFRTRLGPGLSNVNWCKPGEGPHHSSDQVLVLATFFPFRAGVDHRLVNRTAGGHKFDLGNVHASPAIYPLYADSSDFREQIDIALRRHHRGDWGEVPQEDWDKNDAGLFEEFEPAIPSRLRFRDKLWSLYCIDGEEILIITSPDRTVTEILFMREYC